MNAPLLLRVAPVDHTFLVLFAPVGLAIVRAGALVLPLARTGSDPQGEGALRLRPVAKLGVRNQTLDVALQIQLAMDLDLFVHAQHLRIPELGVVQALDAASSAGPRLEAASKFRHLVLKVRPQVDAGAPLDRHSRVERDTCGDLIGPENGRLVPSAIRRDPDGPFVQVNRDAHDDVLLDVPDDTPRQRVAVVPPRRIAAVDAPAVRVVADALAVLRAGCPLELRARQADLRHLAVSLHQDLKVVAA
mmetsp:Transcript_102955/g.297662  ORF Transcript_102955/g.297662 Transcript_102955/m.297662 type:complete len:247 (-) Transcript_102955:640-1380(-)